MVEEITTIINAAQQVAQGMTGGDRMPVKKMAEKVGLALSMEPSKVFPFVNYFAHNDTEGKVSAGKHGGYIRKTVQTIITENTKTEPSTENTSITEV